MPKLNQYPRGYVSILDGSGLGTTPMGEGDIITVSSHAEIEMLYAYYIQRTVDPTGWTFRREVFRTCAKLFGDFQRWLVLQAVYNDNVYDLNFRFLLDTVQFIREGRRDMSVFTWNDLLLEYPETQVGVAGPRRLDEFKLSDPKEFSNVIGQWCSKENGFEDMLCTAHVLYGVSKKPMGAPNSKL